jgi:hypothetical protein
MVQARAEALQREPALVALAAVEVEAHQRR